MNEAELRQAIDEKIEEIEKRIERLGKEAENDHSERMLAAMAEAVREEKKELEWLKYCKRLLEKEKSDDEPRI